MDLRVIIADDDDGMRLLLKKALDKQNDIQIVGEGVDGEEALHLYETLNPDVVFLDVEMPKINGIECAKKIADINPKAVIIFVTAFNDYMPQAFELYAFDYLIKPFKIDRLKQTIERIKSIETKEDTALIHKIIKYEKGLEKLIVKNKEGLSFVDIKDIIIIQRENRSTVLYTEKDSFSTSESLSILEEKLDRNLFFRSHKSYIINISMIEKIYPYGRWTYIVKLKNTDKDALLTHERFNDLERIFTS
ncbi:LytR/AlgR family response regulator transcription factor [Alkaliphilus serpentinus]|uniref:Stage 0 sporulation protein A homolog n=1 Tax=Alkaliphilus serpentinus TaxID=1482731 RepID=A0A833M731_9FIRM|nr:LytTR family DNA-binding domain-containing protein [Alkaliphilus serpentinus]KAB3526340.1 response regulator transcription factor [Alkaliphilus serpentinus]